MANLSYSIAGVNLESRIFNAAWQLGSDIDNYIRLAQSKSGAIVLGPVTLEPTPAAPITFKKFLLSMNFHPFGKFYSVIVLE